MNETSIVGNRTLSRSNKYSHQDEAKAVKNASTPLFELAALTPTEQRVNREKLMKFLSAHGQPIAGK